MLNTRVTEFACSCFCPRVAVDQLSCENRDDESFELFENKNKKHSKKKSKNQKKNAKKKKNKQTQTTKNLKTKE